MARLRELPGIGVGLISSPEAQRAATALTWRERRSVQSRVRTGRPAWDEPSARYAIELARAQQRMSRPFGTFRAAPMMWIVAVVMWASVALRVSDGDLGVETILVAMVACSFVLAAIRAPVWERNAPRAEALNEPLIPHGAPPPNALVAAATPRQEAVGAGIAALTFGIPFGLSVGLSDASWASGLIGGAFFGISMVLIMRRIYRGKRRA